MKDLGRTDPPKAGAPEEMFWALLKDMAAVSRAQARLTGHLVDLVARLETEAGRPLLWGEGRAASTLVQPGREPRIGEEVCAQANAIGAEAIGAGAIGVESSIGAQASIEADASFGTAAVSEEPVAAAIGVAPAGAELAPVSATPDETGEAATAAGPAQPAATPAGSTEHPAPKDVVIEEPAPPVAGNGSEPAVESAETGEALAEGEENEDESGNAMVLVLESCDARVGVLWDQVVQIGSLSTSRVPDTVTTDRGDVKLASLGTLLRGLSNEEKYFVILEHERERAGIACERMLGLGPLASVARQEKDSHIQVLRVPMLQAISKQTVPEPPEPVLDCHRTFSPDVQDRQGPPRALVAVRYLPARVALCRQLRGRGWQVGEAAGLEAATVSLDLGRWDALFLEAKGNGETDDMERALIRRVGEAKVPVIRVGSRLSGFPGRDTPALMFPFSEMELDAILIQTCRRVEA